MASDEEGTQLSPLNTSWRNFGTNESSGIFGESDQYTRKIRTYSQWSPMEEGVTLAWNDVSVYIQTKKKGKTTCKRIINGVTGAVKAGSLVALMGASGAGKSTLMSTLAYRNASGACVEGDILINGRPIGDYMKYISGFMHQEDIFIGSLTVLEHMNIMARLKLDRKTTQQERNSKIYEILKSLGLTKCLNTRIGINGESKVLSGGEKKRLAFATELLTDPPILFCDEPTTGLDSYSAQKIITMMNTMACSGKTILCTIHQPSSDIFAIFSQLILMADGRIAFMGSAASALDFFEKAGYRCPTSYNPADFFIKTLATTPGYEENSRQCIKRICDYFVVSDYNKEVNVVVQYEFHMGRAVESKIYKLRTNFNELFFWQKLYWLTYRWFLDLWRDPTLQATKISEKIVIGIMIGLCYLGTDFTTQIGVQNVQGIIFLLVSENTFTPMYSILDEFPQKYPLFLREYNSGLYSAFLYFLSRILSMLPGLIIEPILFVIIVYWLSGLRASAYAFLMTTLAGILTLNSAAACGIFFSNAFDSVPAAMAYLVPFDYVLMLTSGVFVKLSTLPRVFSWTKYLSWLMYSTESISIIQWNGIKNITCDISDQEIPCLTSDTQVLEKYSFSEDNLSRDLWSMLFLCIIFHCLSFICLWLKIRKR
ncbi:protein scarlet isoform X2 [Tribolium madens]|uniref:protein scarlet isoform X2 n=1 Tax=Tribolium madens TaxID=41895 RepID=UPI001CF72081|nr:protein scarlet isoform X2 [Tribolium madens]